MAKDNADASIEALLRPEVGELGVVVGQSEVDGGEELELVKPLLSHSLDTGGTRTMTQQRSEVDLVTESVSHCSVGTLEGEKIKFPPLVCLEPNQMRADRNQ